MGHRKNEAITSLRRDKPRRKKIKPEPLENNLNDGEPRVSNTQETEYYDSESNGSGGSQSSVAFSTGSRDAISSHSSEEEKSSEANQSDKSSTFGEK
jgi:hypothetical protein